MLKTAITILQRCMAEAMETYPAGSEWLHVDHDGTLSVRVAGVAISEKTLDVVVLYDHDGVTWVRPAEQFGRRFRRRCEPDPPPVAPAGASGPAAPVTGATPPGGDGRLHTFAQLPDGTVRRCEP